MQMEIVVRDQKTKKGWLDAYRKKIAKKQNRKAAK